MGSPAVLLLGLLCLPLSLQRFIQAVFLLFRQAVIEGSHANSGDDLVRFDCDDELAALFDGGLFPSGSLEW